MGTILECDSKIVRIIAITPKHPLSTSPFYKYSAKFHATGVGINKVTLGTIYLNLIQGSIPIQGHAPGHVF